MNSQSPQPTETKIIIVDKRGDGYGVASFIFGLLSIFILAPIFVPLAVVLGIIAVFCEQYVWGILGLVMATIGFITSPILMALFAFSVFASSPHSSISPSMHSLPTVAYSTPTPKKDPSRTLADDLTIAEEHSLIFGSKLCLQPLASKETEYGIPAHLLTAISTAETGHYAPLARQTFPWPWTLKTDGKTYYYVSEEMALAHLHNLLRDGKKDVSVGCMQVNLQHNPNAFKTPEDAFIPSKNIDVAARALRQSYDITHSWKAAVTHYDTSTTLKDVQYADNVFTLWETTQKQMADERNTRKHKFDTLSLKEKHALIDGQIETVARDCRNRRIAGELDSYTASVNCSSPKIRQAYQSVEYPYMDLVDKLIARRLEVSQRLDSGELTEQEAKIENDKYSVYLTGLESQRYAKR